MLGHVFHSDNKSMLSCLIVMKVYLRNTKPITVAERGPDFVRQKECAEKVNRMSY